MIQSITVFGLASQQIVKVIPLPKNLTREMTLMDFLREHGITIASSCGGVGSCQKCLINLTILSCQITVMNFIALSPPRNVEVSYL